MSLKDAIGRDIYTIDNDTFSDFDLQSMSTEALESLKLRINNLIGILSSDIKVKQIEYSNGGMGATKEWYVKHKRALSINQRVLPYINGLIKQRSKGERAISDFFMDTARAVLSQKEFEGIMAIAQREREEQREGIYGTIR